MDFKSPSCQYCLLSQHHVSVFLFILCFRCLILFFFDLFRSLNYRRYCPSFKYSFVSSCTFKHVYQITMQGIIAPTNNSVTCKYILLLSSHSLMQGQIKFHKLVCAVIMYFFVRKHFKSVFAPTYITHECYTC